MGKRRRHITREHLQVSEAVFTISSKLCNRNGGRIAPRVPRVSPRAGAKGDPSKNRTHTPTSVDGARAAGRTIACTVPRGITLSVKSGLPPLI